MANISSKQQLWQSRITECQDSSMSAKQWCQENHVAYSTYLYWARKINSKADTKEEALPEDPVFAQLPSEQAIRNFSLRVDAPVAIFLGRVRIEISSDCPQNLLQSFVEILKRYA